jgi:hypothetical protein
MDATDLRNTRARLKRLAIAAAIGLVLTFFTMKAMSSGRPPNHDPVGSSTMPLLAIFVFVLETMIAHKIISKKR